jgi:hypothetical protein
VVEREGVRRGRLGLGVEVGGGVGRVVVVVVVVGVGGVSVGVGSGIGDTGRLLSPVVSSATAANDALPKYFVDEAVDDRFPTFPPSREIERAWWPCV